MRTWSIFPQLIWNIKSHNTNLDNSKKTLPFKLQTKITALHRLFSITPAQSISMLLIYQYIEKMRLAWLSLMLTLCGLIVLTVADSTSQCSQVLWLNEGHTMLLLQDSWQICMALSVYHGCIFIHTEQQYYPFNWNIYLIFVNIMLVLYILHWMDEQKNA